MIDLCRAYLPDGSATLGLWTVGAENFCTLELPWADNKPFVSCIPEGEYSMAQRASTVVYSASRGRYQNGWEIRDVPGREWIMCHPGNWATDTQGCLLIGTSFWWTEQGPMVTRSQEAFARFMKAMSARGNWKIRIRCNTITENRSERGRNGF